MSDTIGTAIARIQAIALALNSVTDIGGNAVSIAFAPTYPVENEPQLPASIALLMGGTFNGANKSMMFNYPLINVEFHLSRVNLKQTYMQTDQVAYEFPRRLAGDPTLNSSVTTIVYTGDQQINYNARPFVWREKTATSPALITQCVTFEVMLKILVTPLTTA